MIFFLSACGICRVQWTEKQLFRKENIVSIHLAFLFFGGISLENPRHCFCVGYPSGAVDEREVVPQRVTPQRFAVPHAFGSLGYESDSHRSVTMFSFFFFLILLAHPDAD